jgi:hypothetical protein
MMGPEIRSKGDAPWIEKNREKAAGSGDDARARGLGADDARIGIFVRDLAQERRGAELVTI